jgi:hypothetical protein
VENAAARDAAKLPDAEQSAVAAVVSNLGAAFGNPHRNAGIGLRKLRPGVFECRAGLATRLVFVRLGDVLLVRCIGDHADVKRFLRR